jgi:hypothetical protein
MRPSDEHAGWLSDSRPTGRAPAVRRASAFPGVRVVPTTLWPPSTSSGREIAGQTRWGGEDSNLRAADYESGHAQGVDLQEFLNLLVRSIT